MFIGKSSITIARNRIIVYKAACTYPSFVSSFLPQSRVVFEDENSLLVEVHSVLGGFLKTAWRGKGEKISGKAIHFTQIQGLFKGLRAHWSFVSRESDQTRVTILTSFSKPAVTPIGEMILGRFLVERTTGRILRDLKRTAETFPE